MKKFIYIILLAISTSLVISSCTEESVTPKPLGSDTILLSDKGN